MQPLFHNTAPLGGAGDRSIEELRWQFRMRCGGGGVEITGSVDADFINCVGGDCQIK